MKITKKDFGFLGFQFILFLAFAYDLKSLRIIFPEIVFWLGVVFFLTGALFAVTAVLQLNRNLSPFPSPLPGAKFIGSGVYKFIRHPIYTGLFMAFLGYAIISDSGYRIIISLLLLLLFYFKSQYEETQLKKVFPQYEAYTKTTGRFFPIRLFG